MTIRAELDWDGDQVLREIERESEKALNAAAEVVRTEIVQSMPGKGSRLVTGTGGDSGIRGQYIASNPGQPPGVRKGTLRNSISNERAGRLRRTVGTNLRTKKGKYLRGELLEYGTSKMAARPFMGPGLSRSRDKAIKMFRSTLRKALR